jgi:hypothetical protein
VGNSTRPRRVVKYDDEANIKGFVGCGYMHSLATDATVGLTTQPV